MNNTKTTNNNSYWNKPVTIKEIKEKERLTHGVLISILSIPGMVFISEIFVILGIIGVALVFISALNLIKGE